MIHPTDFCRVVFIPPAVPGKYIRPHGWRRGHNAAAPHGSLFVGWDLSRQRCQANKFAPTVGLVVITPPHARTACVGSDLSHQRCQANTFVPAVRRSAPTDLRALVKPEDRLFLSAPISPPDRRYCSHLPEKLIAIKSVNAS